ncbi:uncharacterized protein EDB93DRAFT_1101805 [Suillus bovinus]|uniref:uncharacterized protein n=1 Tax=Suillus bovinus TaxID=48563 RepID=UPI001B87C707|nr:uncharacterized protein EDB93DRAFT_1101805 [Suillus bovinus]KAG2155232.1 hypothetical protein EDB93DRAFT_1101805 [Suillus bovinus]
MWWTCQCINCTPWYNPTSTMNSIIFSPLKVKSAPSRLHGTPQPISRMSPAITNDVPSTNQPRFSLASIAALDSNTFAQEFTKTERQAAARALLRHDAHLDGTHFHTRKPTGLHPSYIAFNSYTTLDEKSMMHEEFVEAALQDLLMQSQCKTILMAGSLLLFVVLALKLHQLFHPSISLSISISHRVNYAFGEEFAVPHLQHFTERCHIEGVVPPHHHPASQVNPSAVPHLPVPMAATGSRIHCSVRPPQQFQHDLQANAQSNTATSSAVQEGRAMALLDSDMPPNKIRRRRPANTFFTKGLMVPGTEIQEMRAPTSFTPPLISLGPHTDAVLDRFKMDDMMLLRLHAFIRSIRSSHWEAVLRSPKWDLTYEQASNLARALLVDLQGVHQQVYMNFVAPMVLHSFMVTNSRRWVQAQPSRRPKVTLSKEARAAITAQCRNKSHQFRVALHNAWDELDETMKTIASSHHKSFCHVQNDLCMGHEMLCYQRSKLSAWNMFCWKKHHEDKENGATGKAVLQDLIRDENCDEYCNLTDNEKAQLLQEYREHKETKTTGIHILTKSKVNDVTQTLKAVENELKNLWTCTGAESILYTTRGSTDLPLRGIAFATEGVHEFMGSVMNIDDQDLVSKMEGFAVQGMKGAARNHQKRTSDIWSTIHQEINKTLRCVHLSEPSAGSSRVPRPVQTSQVTIPCPILVLLTSLCYTDNIGILSVSSLIDDL